MGRIIVEQHVTADGFAAGPNGELDWVDGSVSSPGPMVDQALAELDHTDAILLGANTYGLFIGYWPQPAAAQDPLAEPINRIPKHVVSSTLAAAPWGDFAPATLETGNVIDTCDRLTSLYERDIIVWGSLQLAGALMDAGCVSQLRLRVAPVAIGSGIPLWSAPYRSRGLSLASVTPLSTGQVSVSYDIS